LRQRRAVLIHAHFGMDGASALPLASYLGLPMVVSYHGGDVTVRDDVLARGSFSQRKYLRLRDRVARESQLHLCASEFLRDRLLTLGFPADRTLLHYIGIDTTRFSPSLATARGKQVLFVGRLVESKGLNYLLQAWKLVSSRLPGWRLLVVGEGPQAAAYHDMAAHARLPVDFVGTVRPAEVCDLMRRSRVLCVPSVTTSTGAQEGLGLVSLEAQAVGTPVVAFSSGGVPETIANGQTGLVYRERDVRGLGQGILRLADDAAMWHQVSENACRRVREKFDLQRQNHLLEGYYDAASQAYSHPLG